MTKYNVFTKKGEFYLFERNNNFIAGFHLHKKSIFYVFGIYLNSPISTKKIGIDFNHFLNQFEIIKITAIVHSKNIKSKNLIYKLGFVLKENIDLGTSGFYTTSAKNVNSLIEKWK